MRGLSVCLPFQVFTPARASARTVVIDQPMSALSLRIFSMLTRAAPGSTCTSSSGNFFLITSAVAAAMGVHVPPVGPAEKMRPTGDWAGAAAGLAATRTAASAAMRQRIRVRAVIRGTSLVLSVSEKRRDPAARVEAERARLAHDREVGALGDGGQERFRAFDLAEHQGVLDPDHPGVLGRGE